jgi:hypothetical protein
VLFSSVAVANSTEMALLLVLATVIVVLHSRVKNILDLSALHPEAALKASTGESLSLGYFKATVHAFPHHNPSAQPNPLYSQSFRRQGVRRRSLSIFRLLT